MSKKFTKTILSSAVAGLMFVSFSSLSAKPTDRVVGKYTINFGENGEQATIFDSGKKVIIADTVTGTITTFNSGEWEKKVKENGIIDVEKHKDKVQSLLESVRYTIDAPSLKKENLDNITAEALDKIKTNVEAVSKIITSETAPAYNAAVRSGMSSENALKIAGEKNASVLLNEFGKLNKNVNQLKNATTFALDENGEITDGQGVESVSVKSVVAGVKADTTIYQNKDGSYTLDQSAPDNVRVNDAVVSLDNRTRSNTQAIQNHSRQLQEHNARLNSQQRQIRENHEEMKRAAAQSAALSGLFQPYSVGKFNATAALGGYSDKQAVAVGVGYRFNEQTAAKAGIAASDGDVSYNVGVNFEF
ncbi:TPA: YadA C-terminal domain-containing protein [Escherichia coli]|uniref:YadA C-terminal domain-containing protein n=1 Tax=Escherichia coli TaxID=562 RepID=UPI0030975FD1|nr:YadA-like family protein [Escherichia coli]